MTKLYTDLYGRTDKERAELQKKIDAANKEARDNWDDDKWRRDMSLELTAAIYRGFEHENLLGLFGDVENAPFDGRVHVRETRGLKAYWIARGGYIETSTLHSEVTELPRDLIGFHVYEMEDKLRYNFAETQATLVSLASQRMDAEINKRVLALFQAAVPDSSPYYSDGAGLSLTALNTAMREVRDETNDFNVTIVGRVTMTDQIIEELTANGTNTGFIPETNESVLARGVMGTYRGARIVTLTNYDDANRTPYFPGNELYVIGRDAAKFAFWGGLVSKQYVEQDNWYWHYLAKREFGGLVHRPSRIRRIVDTSIDDYVNKAS